MDKKGMGFKTIVVLVLILVTFGIVLIWQIGFGKQIAETTESTKCQASLLQAGSFLGKLKEGELPNLPGCGRIDVDIESSDKNGIMEEILDKVVIVSNDFCSSNIFTRIEGRYCRKRYHPITFNNKGIKISGDEFEKYLSDNPVNLKCGFLRPKEINTNSEYSILFVADFSENVEGWGEWFFLGKRYESENKNVALTKTDTISDMGCISLI